MSAVISVELVEGQRHTAVGAVGDADDDAADERISVSQKVVVNCEVQLFWRRALPSGARTRERCTFTAAPGVPPLNGVVIDLVDQLRQLHFTVEQSVVFLSDLCFSKINISKSTI